MRDGLWGEKTLLSEECSKSVFWYGGCGMRRCRVGTKFGQFVFVGVCCAYIVPFEGKVCSLGAGPCSGRALVWHSLQAAGKQLRAAGDRAHLLKPR